MLKKYKNKQTEEDLADRKAYLVETKFETVLGEEVTYTCWSRLDGLLSGLRSYNELELLERTLTVNERTYNTKHIVHMESQIVEEGYVKESVKKKMDGYKGVFTSWSFNKNHIEEDIE